MNRLLLGKTGEIIAARYLEHQGYQILSKNWRFKRLEIDLVASYQEKIILVEVKTRRQNYSLSELLSPAQRNHLCRAGQEFCQQKNLSWNKVDFDLIFILIRPQSNKITLKHITKII